MKNTFANILISVFAFTCSNMALSKQISYTSGSVYNHSWNTDAITNVNVSLPMFDPSLGILRDAQIHGQSYYNLTTYYNIPPMQGTIYLWHQYSINDTYIDFSDGSTGDIVFYSVGQKSSDVTVFSSNTTVLNGYDINEGTFEILTGYVSDHFLEQVTGVGMFSNRVEQKWWYYPELLVNYIDVSQLSIYPVVDYSKYDFEITYTYSGFVPEPAVWMQLVLGFGLLGAAIRMRAKIRCHS